MKNHILVLVLLPLFNIPLSGQQIVTDRPDQTESSSAVGKGVLQIESGIFFGFTGEDRQAERQILAPTTLFRLGLIDMLELRLVSQFESLKYGAEKINGISDLEIGTKVQILQNEDINAEIALLSHLVIPSGSEGLSSKKTGTVNKLCISHTLTEDIGAGYNLGYNYFGSGSGDLTYSLAIGVGIFDKVGVYIEPFGEIADLDEFVLDVDAGATYLLMDNLQLDFSFGTGITRRMNYLSFGFSWYLGTEE